MRTFGREKAFVQGSIRRPSLGVQQVDGEEGQAARRLGMGVGRVRSAAWEVGKADRVVGNVVAGWETCFWEDGNGEGRDGGGLERCSGVRIQG